MSGFPRLEFSCDIFLPSLSQFCHDPGVLCRQPIVELVQRLDGREDLLRDLDYVTRHDAIVRPHPPKHNPSCSHGPVGRLRTGVFRLDGDGPQGRGYKVEFSSDSARLTETRLQPH